MQTQKGYIGERFDPETGLQYLNATYYDPTFGRYVSADDGESSVRRGWFNETASEPNQRSARL